MKKTLIAAALGLACVIPQAEASLFNFSYTLAGGDVIAGQVDGTLQADNNTLVINSVLDFATFNGVDGPSLPFVASVDTFINITPGLSPTLTLDGSFMDFIACTDGSCNDGLSFNAGNSFSLLVAGGTPVYNSGAAFGNTLEPFNTANWNIQAVPTPAAIWLLGSGLIGLFGMRKKLNFAA